MPHRIRTPKRGPDSIVYPNRGVFHEIAEPERLVFSIGVGDQQGNMPHEGLNTLTLVEDGGKTTLTLGVRIVKATAGSGPMLAGIDAAWTQSLERLQVQLKLAQQVQLSSGMNTVQAERRACGG